MQLASRFEAAGWGMHSVFLEANEDGCIDTETLECHISGGLVFAVVLSEFRQITELLDRASVPYVVVDGYTREFPNARAVIRDSKSECYAELVNYMKASGMKTMLEIDYERRMDRAFKKLLADSGIIVRRELCRFDNETIHQLSDVREIGFNAVSRFLSGNKRQLPDIVLFDDDYLAAGGVLAIFKAGLRIPDDIAVATHSNKGDEMLIGVPHCRIENDPVSQGDIIAKYVLMLLDGHDARPPCNKLRFLTIS
jgi:DNA-binding LacI/PurR family transcriptional regulator